MFTLYFECALEISQHYFLLQQQLVVVLETLFQDGDRVKTLAAIEACLTLRLPKKW